jgi:hypothetical protein
MKALLVCIAVMIGQMNTMQKKQVVHLNPHRNTIDENFGGKLLELVNAPTVISLPETPPRLDSQGNPWCVDVKNLGPDVVTVVGKGQFTSRIMVGQTVHVFSNGTAYSLNRWFTEPLRSRQDDLSKVPSGCSG